ncbi:MAG: helix-turn-helix transcriptional regulator [Desulfosporosinus sp.]|nr:helix-turn-helix transcriptional regulator [Desulfosporosinus sp.]
MSAITEFVTPRLFSGQKQYPYLQVDDFSYVEYRSSSNQYRNHFIITSYLFVVILSGEKIIHTPGGDLHIKEGEAFFAQKGTYLFSEILATQDEYRTLVFFIGDSFLELFLRRHSRFLGLQSGEEIREIFIIPVSPLLETSINSVLPYFLHRTDLSQQLLRLKLEELLLHIVDADPGKHFIGFLHAQYFTRRRELRSLMEKYFMKRVTIAELAKLSGRSLSAFKREFREAFNESPRRWITCRRLDQAKVLLAESNLNIGEICFRVGFDNFSHFSQIFKRKYGFPPSSLQKIRN